MAQFIYTKMQILLVLQTDREAKLLLKLLSGTERIQLFHQSGFAHQTTAPRRVSRPTDFSRICQQPLHGRVLETSHLRCLPMNTQKQLYPPRSENKDEFERRKE